MAVQEDTQAVMAVSTDTTTAIPLDSTVPNEVPSQPISLDANVNTYPIAPEYVPSRAFKASFGLQNTAAAQDPETLSQAILGGQEAAARDQAATTLNQGVAQAKQDAVVTLAQKPGSITDDDLKWINGAPAFNTYFDPKSVFETNYANAYTNELNKFSAQAGDANAWNILKQFPGDGTSAFDATSQFGTKGMAWHEYILNRLQGTQSKINNQSTAGFVADFTKMAFPILNPYYEAKMRSNIPGVSFFDGLLGSNLDKQRQKLLSMPMSEGFKAFDSVMDKLDQDNPQAAAAFAASMLGQSSFDYFQNQLNTVGNLTDIGGAGVAALKAGGVVYKTSSLMAQARRAVQTAGMSNAVSPEMTRANILAAVGNNKEAAIIEAGEKVANTIKGSINPTTEALDALPRFMRSDVANIAADPGPLTTTQVNTIINDYKTQESNLMKTLAEVMRSTGLPLEKATPEVMRSLSEAAYANHPGMKNAIIRLSDPTLEPISNEYHVTAWVGKGAGEFFGSEDEALQYARYHGYSIKYTPEQIDNIKVRLDDIKAEIKAGPEMDADTAGLNRYYGLDKQLKDLEAQYAEATRSTSGYLIKKSGVSVGQQGAGYYIEMTKPLPFTAKVVRDFIYNPDRLSSVTPDSWTKYVPFLNKMRTPEDTLSSEHNAMRKAVAYPQAKLLQLAHSEWQTHIKPLNKEESTGLREALRYTQGQGKDFENPAQLRDWYLRNLDRDPTFNEQRAYFATKRWNEMDLTLRELALHRNKALAGADTHELIIKDANGAELRSGKFDGIIRSRMPSGNKNVLIMGPDAESSKVIPWSTLTLKEKNELGKFVKTGGMKLIEPYDPFEYPFKDFVKDGDKVINYVLTDKSETSPLRYTQLPQRGGGHFVYEYDHYLKQAKIVREKVGTGDKSKLNVRYDGDTTVAGVPYRAMGQDLGDKMNEVRLAIKAGKNDLAQALTTKHLPFEWADLVKKYKTGVFNLDEPFQVVPKGKLVIDMDDSLARRHTNFTDDTRTGLARNFQVQFTGQRDAEEFHTVVNTGTQASPVYAFRPGEKVDPIETMNRALGGIIHSTFMDDYKTYGVLSWLKEAAPHFSRSFVKNPEEVWSSPYKYYKLANDKSFASGTPPEVVANFLQNKFKIDQFVGTPSVWDTFLHSIAQDLADTIASRGGVKLAEKITPSWLLSATRDPFSFIRGVTFDAYLGFGYIPQIFVQMASFVNMFAISPRYAVAGTFGSYLHLLSKVNGSEEILNHLDNLATKMRIPGVPNWRPGEWKESIAALDRTGFSNVGAEYGPLANLKYAKPVQLGAETFLNWGRKPFQMGESATRVGAWHIAFKEFRDKFPTGAISREDLKTIIDRADLLYGNMSHASNSVLHTGILSLPTQFYAYQLRQAELFWGKRLGATPAERMATRARLLAVNSAIFGVPMGLGYTGLPAADYLRQEMLQNGFFGQTKPYSVDTAQQTNTPRDWIEHLLMEGIPSTAFTLITGNNYNIGPRYGSQGFNQIRDGLMGDSGFLGTVMGPSGSLIANTYKNTWPALYAMRSIITGEGNIKPVADDFINIVNQVQTVNKLWGLKAALQTGHLVTKTSGYVMDTTKANAIGMAIFGLQPQEQVDMHHMETNAKDETARVKWYTDQFTQNWNRGLLAEANNDPEQSQKFMANAVAYLTIGGLNAHDIGKALASVNRNRLSLIDRVAWSTLVGPNNHYPKAMQEQNQQLYGTIHRYLENRTQQ